MIGPSPGPHAASLCGGAGEVGLLCRAAQGVLTDQTQRCCLQPVASRVAHYDMRGGTCDLFNYSALHFLPTTQKRNTRIDCLKDPSL